MIKYKTKGLIAAPFTAMDEKGSVNLEIIESYADHLKGMGVKGAFVAGTTGEGMLLSDEERLTVIKTWIDQKTDDFRVIAHAGSTSLSSAKTIAYESARAGADAIAIMGPPFLGPKNVEDLVDFCKDVALAAPETPFYYYHMPVLSGVNISMTEFLNQAENKIPNLAGIKFTDNNLMEMSNCLSVDNGKWDILHGYDELLIAGLAFGAEGAVGSTYNFIAPLYYGIIEDFQKGDIESARKKQRKSIEFIAILIRYHGALVSGKALMGLLGIDCGACRKPMPQLTPDERVNFESELRDWGFFEMVRSFPQLE
ncbi:dihydrodipicolinate synthase family protein [uncultured Kriegella sp.]|uniref:dihydrodipicolinate synthase family protein n=1 Tax=uncultured Kriegella sp. TaxID=1798910 RepID=UPI0030DC5A17|tara:strand:+ start:4865 stop:5797 length:933 start_codon:yes stop_codon:yes gene_type:complete